MFLAYNIGKLVSLIITRILIVRNNKAHFFFYTTNESK